MSGVNTYKDLIVWQKAIRLVLLVYQITKDFPEDEKYGLVSQMRRCAVSIPSNISEGYARKGNNEFARFLCIVYGSACELETQLYIALELEYLSQKKFDTVNESHVVVLKMLNKLMGSIEKTKY